MSMAQPPTAISTGDASSAPLTVETTLQPSTESAPVTEDVSKASQEVPVATGESLVTETEASVPTPQPGPEPKAAIKHSGLVVHHLNNSRSQRILWLLEELEVPYELKKYQRKADQRAPKELKEVHSLGKSPVITDGDITLAESGAIVEYIISKYGEQFCPTEAGRVDDLYFTHYAEGSLMPMLITKYLFTLIPQRSPALLRPFLKPVFAQIDKQLVNPELKAHSALFESHLEKSKTNWLAGGDHPTAADFMMFFPAEIMVLRGIHAGPKMKEYVQRIHQRPAYKQAIEKGGKYDYAKL